MALILLLLLIQNHNPTPLERESPSMFIPRASQTLRSIPHIRCEQKLVNTPLRSMKSNELHLHICTTAQRVRIGICVVVKLFVCFNSITRAIYLAYFSYMT